MMDANKQHQLAEKEYTLEVHGITDLETFTKVTHEPRQIPGLYYYKLLDCLVDLAYAITQDFFKRPHLYTGLGEISPLLAKLNARCGNDERLPSKLQRSSIFIPIFGEPKGHPGSERGDFTRLSNELNSAAAAFSERVFDTGVEMLRERVRKTHRPFKEYLDGLLGDSIRWSKEEALSNLTESTSYTILRKKEIAAIFGISTPPKNTWPYTEDANADKLVEEIARRLKGNDDTNMPLTREYFSNLQRTALRGAEALATIVDYSENGSTVDDLDLLILKCYSWGSALKSIHRSTMSEE